LVAPDGGTCTGYRYAKGELIQDFPTKREREMTKKKGSEELLLLLEETVPAASLKCGCTWRFRDDGTCDIYTSFPAVKELLLLWLDARGYQAVVVH